MWYFVAGRTPVRALLPAVWRKVCLHRHFPPWLACVGYNKPKNCSLPFTMGLRLPTEAPKQALRVALLFSVGGLYAKVFCSSKWLAIHATSARDESIQRCFMIPAKNCQTKWKTRTAASKKRERNLVFWFYTSREQWLTKTVRCLSLPNRFTVYSKYRILKMVTTPPVKTEFGMVFLHASTKEVWALD